MDLTPWVGIIGAVVGGSIGLVGQRMNIREQRRKDTRGRVADFLREVDRIQGQTVMLMYAMETQNKEKLDRSLAEIRLTLQGTLHRRQYIELTSPALVRRRTKNLASTTSGLSEAAVDYITSNGASLAQPHMTSPTRFGTKRGLVWSKRSSRSLRGPDNGTLSIR